jgi:hypothetical protein
VGFSFLALYSQPAGVVHGGHVEVEGGEISRTEVLGCDVGGRYVKDVNIVFESGGIWIAFNKTFEATPSVIVTPYNVTSSSALPIAVVDHVTKHKALVKVETWNTNTGFIPSNFDFVVVGPPEQRKVKPFVMPEKGAMSMGSFTNGLA